MMLRSQYTVFSISSSEMTILASDVIDDAEAAVCSISSSGMTILASDIIISF